MGMLTRTLLFLLAALPVWSASSFVYFGTYTGARSKGIYVSRFDAKTGNLEPARLAAEIVRPSWVTIHPNGRFLYAVSELGNDAQSQGAITAFAIDASTGTLTKLNSVPSGGGAPCHLAITAKGTHIAVANYGSGSTAVFALSPDGKLGSQTGFIQHQGSSANPRRQRGPHAHAVVLSADNSYLLVPDLGTDEYITYALANGKISAKSAAKVKPGLGPRHFAFHPSHRFAFGLNEMGSSVTAFTYNSGDGSLKEIDSYSTLPADFKNENNSAEIAVDAKGRFVYASNRGHDSITVFSINEKGGLLLVDRTATGGKTPRNFSLDPSGRWLLAANQDSDNVVVFKVDPKTGRLTNTNRILAVGAPVCIAFLPAR